VFKVYVANQIKNKIPYFIGQHGNNYFTRIHHNYLSELNYSDKFISWGVEKKPNIKSSFNFRTLKKRNFFNQNGKLIIIFAHSHHMNLDLFNTDQSVFNHARDMIKVIKNLKSDIKQKTILRLNQLFYSNHFGIKYYDLFKDLGVEIDNGKKDIYKLLKESRLSFFNYDSTGILENFIYNHPTIFFCENNFLNNINNEYLDKYKILLRNNIMFTNEEKLVNHINANWNQISNWWMSRKNQKILKEFNKEFNNKPHNNSLNNLKEILI
jgi:putative transferase (TIGR04331 family)